MLMKTKSATQTKNNASSPVIPFVENQPMKATAAKKAAILTAVYWFLRCLKPFKSSEISSIRLW